MGKTVITWLGGFHLFFKKKVKRVKVKD